MNKYIYWSLLAVFIASCSTPEEDNPVKEDEPEVLTEETFDFDENEFKDSVHVELLKELDICDLRFNDSSMYAPCTPEYFQILPFHKDKSIKDAFVLYVKAAIPLKGFPYLLPVRHVIVFERENGRLVRLNGFRGELVEMRDGKNGYKDLIVSLYLTGDETLFDCLFTYENKKYSFESVEGIDWGEGIRNVKESVKDSVSKEVYNDLMEKSLIF
jgi:hypothetical protein